MQQPAFAPGVAPPRRPPTPLRRRFNRVGSHNQPPKMISIMMSADIPIEARASFTWCIETSITARLDYIDDLKEQLFMCTHNQFMPQPVKDALQHRLDTTQEWFTKERRCIVAFRFLVARWLYNRYKNRKLNEEDPATLAIPTKPVIIYDSKQHGVYCFEVTTIRKRCETALTFAQWMFPEPKRPSNPLTNLPFTDGQLLAIIQACRNYGFGSWLLEAYRRAQWDLKGFLSLYMIPLKIRALDDLCRNNTDGEFQDMMTDFIEDHHAYHRIAFASHLKIIKWAIIHEPNTEYIKSWMNCFRRMHHIRIVHASEMNQQVLDALDEIYEETLELFHDFGTIAAIGQRRLQTLPRRRVSPPNPVPEPAPVVLPAVLVAVQNTELNVDPNIQSEQLALSLVRGLIEDLINAEPPQD